jgi:TetR/AcrR family transcriptional regulator
MPSREKIMEAADGLFGECGFDGTTVQRISEVSRTNKALIHYHFKSKEGLFESVLDRYFEHLSDTLQTALLGEGPLDERLGKLVDRYMDFLEKNRNFVHIIQREVNGGKQMQRVIRHMVPIFRLVLRAIQEAYPSTRSADIAAEQLLVSGYGMIVSYFTYANLLKHILPSDPMSRENLLARREHIHRMIGIIGQVVMSGPADGSNASAQGKMQGESHG